MRIYEHTDSSGNKYYDDKPEGEVNQGCAAFIAGVILCLVLASLFIENTVLIWVIGLGLGILAGFLIKALLELIENLLN